VESERHGFHERLVERFGERWGAAIYTFAACLLSLAVSGLAAYFTGQPLLFPSLGPTAFLFFEQPMAEMSSPRNTLIGHLVAVLAGALSLAVFGLLEDPSILVEGVTLAPWRGRSHSRSRGRSCSCSGLRTRRRARRRSS
jgi:CBS domain-containing membrane protein